MSLEFGQRLREMREKKGFTQAELAKLCELGLSTISFYESGKREPNYKTLLCMADKLDTTPDYLLTGKVSGEELEKPWYEKDTPPTATELEKIIMEQQNLRIFGDPLDQEARDDVYIALKAVWEVIREKRSAKR